MPRASKASRAAKPAKKVPARKSGAKKTTPVKAPAKRATPAKKAVSRTTVKKATPAKKKAAPAKKQPPQKAVAKKTTTTRAAPQKAAPVKKAPVKRGGKVVLDKFQLEQQALLLAERATYVEQAEALKAEADQLAAEMEPGDIQFDDESGEGATATVDRERDLALSAQARQEIEEIDHARAKMQLGTYGICESCGQPIPKARLKAIPHARLCVACKSGGLSRR